MPGALSAVDHNAALLQQLPKKCRREFRRIFDRQRFIRPWIVERDISPKRQHRRTRFAIDENPPPRARWRSNHAIVNVVVIGKRNDADKCVLACAVGGQNIYEHHIVINGERRNRSAIGPHQIILAPAFPVALEGEVRIVGDYITVHILHPLSHQFIG